MKSLGAIVCLGLLVVPFIGTSAPNEINPYVLDAMRVNAAVTGHNPDLSNAVLLGSGGVDLTGAAGVQAVYDVATGVFTVTPVVAMPDLAQEDATTQHGCIVPSTSTIGYGYTKAGTPLPPTGDQNGGCAYNPANFYEHPGGVSSITLICQGTSQFCYVVTFGYVQANFNYAYMYAYCNNSSGLNALRFTDAAPPPNGPATPIGTGAICYAYGFNSGQGWDPAGASSYGFVYHFPNGGATTYGLLNY